MEGRTKTASTAKKTSAAKRNSGAKKKTTSQAAVKKITEPLVFGLDIGTRSIVGTVGYRENTNHFVVVAQVTMEHETRAMMDGQIHDIQAVAQTITEVKKKLESMIGRKLTDVCIAAAGRVLKTIVAKARVDFNYETVITSEHIYSLDMLGVEQAYDILRQETGNSDVRFYCVGYSVIRYYQNGYPISNLEGHKASSIETELIATFLPDEVVDGLYAAVEKAGLFVANLTLEPIAAINVAIPERFRLLNIALVDVGAGTSDISITNDGSILAYGMIPAAGDEVTECLARHYLTDFAEAEKMKCQSTTRKQVTYHDIMGLSHKLPAEEVAGVMDKTVRDITRQVAERIIELNGGRPVSAVFVVGGGGKVKGFVESLAEYLELPEERVALRGSEVLGNVEFIQERVKVDSLLVTPIGICLNYYEQRNNFIFVTVNDERIKLYDNSKLTVVDAAMQIGFPKDDLFPKRGKALNYTVNGEKRMKRGEAGEAAIVKKNGRESSLNDAIEPNDKIEIIASTCGADAVMTIEELVEYHSTMQFIFNKKQIFCPRFVRVNGELVSAFYEIRENDAIEIVNYYTLRQVLEFMDIAYQGKVYVNNVIGDMDTKVYENFSVACEIKKEEPSDQNLMTEYGEGQIPEQSRLSLQAVDMQVQVNGETVILQNKREYILVDVLDFYPFDLSIAKGDRLETLINGVSSDFTDPLHAGDDVKIDWVNEVENSK